MDSLLSKCPLIHIPRKRDLEVISINRIAILSEGDFQNCCTWGCHLSKYLEQNCPSFKTPVVLRSCFWIKVLFSNFYNCFFIFPGADQGLKLIMLATPNTWHLKIITNYAFLWYSLTQISFGYNLNWNWNLFLKVAEILPWVFNIYCKGIVMNKMCICATRGNLWNVYIMLK